MLILVFLGEYIFYTVDKCIFVENFFYVRLCFPCHILYTFVSHAYFLKKSPIIIAHELLPMNRELYYRVI